MEFTRKHVEGVWYHSIKSGRKIYEGRLNKGDFANLKIGDYIIFYNDDDEFKVKVVEVLKYASFQEMLEDLGLPDVLPGIDTVSNGIKIYREYFSEDQERTYGVLAIKIEIIS